MSFSVQQGQGYQNLKKGIVYALLAWFFFSVMYLIGKLISSQTNVTTMTLFRNGIGMLVATPWMLLNVRENFKTSNPGLIILRGVSGQLNTIFILSALYSLTLVHATVLTNCAPFFVPIISWFWLKKKIMNALWMPMLIGLAGVAFILKPDPRSFDTAEIYAILSAITTATTMITVRIATHTERIQTTIFYAYVVGVILSIPFAIAYWSVDSMQVLFALIGIGIFSFLGQWGLFKSLQYGKASHLASFAYSSVVYSAFFDAIIYHHLPGLSTIIGTLLIIGGGAWVLFILRPKQEPKPLK